MAAKALTTGIKDMVTVLKRYPDIPIAALSLDLVFEFPTAFAEGVSFPSTGKEIVLIQNSIAGAGTFSVASARDQYGRLGDITTYAIAGNTISVLPLGAETLFKDTATGLIIITMSANTIGVAVLRLPNSV